MNNFSKLRSKLHDNLNIADKFICGECTVTISKDLQITIDEEYIGDAKTLEEARSYARSYINSKSIVEEINLIPEEKVVALIKKHHFVEKVTDTLVESYIELASSNIFSVDPVVTDLKERSNSNFAGKLEYVLNDGNTVAINEDTQLFLNTLLQNKYDIIDYMRESKENFMHVISKLKE